MVEILTFLCYNEFVMANKKSDKSIYFEKKNLRQLVKLGLSRQEAEIYLWLVRNGSSRAITIGQKLKILPNSVYRSGRSLVTKGFISITGHYPRWFEPIPPEIALQAYTKQQTLVLNQVSKQLAEDLRGTTLPQDPTHIDVFTGKEEHFFYSKREVDKAKKEILIISIGELIPPDLLLSLHQAHERGVKIKLIVHKYDQENKEVLENFKKNGIEVRHYPDWGFHLVIYDCQKLILVINNPKDTKRRINIFIQSRGLTKALCEYFYSIWAKAVKI